MGERVIRGLVLTSEGAPAANVNVTASNWGGCLLTDYATGTTDAEGRYLLRIAEIVPSATVHAGWAGSRTSERWWPPRAVVDLTLAAVGQADGEPLSPHDVTVSLVGCDRPSLRVFNHLDAEPTDAGTFILTALAADRTVELEAHCTDQGSMIEEHHQLVPPFPSELAIAFTPRVAVTLQVVDEGGNAVADDGLGFIATDAEGTVTVNGGFDTNADGRATVLLPQTVDDLRLWATEPSFSVARRPWHGEPLLLFTRPAGAAAITRAAALRR